MKIFRTISRILLGLMFTIFGANGLHPFIPEPKTVMSADAVQFTTALMSSHYFIAVALLQLIGGLLLLVNRYVPIGLVILGPIIVNILLFHILMQPQGLPPGCVSLVLWLVVYSGVKSAFAGLYAVKTES